MSTKKEYPSRKSTEKTSLLIEMNAAEMTSNLDQLLDEKFKTFKCDIIKKITELVEDSIKYHIGKVEEKFNDKFTELEKKLRTKMTDLSSQTLEIKELKKSTIELLSCITINTIRDKYFI